MPAEEAIEHLMDQIAAIGGADLGIERIELPQAQDLARIDSRRDRPSRC
jgi:hypothetical protein